MSPTCPKFRGQVRCHGCSHHNHGSQGFLKLHAVLHHPDCCTLNTCTNKMGCSLSYWVIKGKQDVFIFLGTTVDTHSQCVGKPHQARNSCIEKEVLCEVRRDLSQTREKKATSETIHYVIFCFSSFTSSASFTSSTVMIYLLLLSLCAPAEGRQRSTCQHSPALAFWEEQPFWEGP